jgi:type IV pilus assembly protein PilV
MNETMMQTPLPDAPTLVSGRNTQRGFTLVEVLIAVLVLAIGLLGLAGLQASSLRFNHDAQLRTQATLLAYDMADRMRANRQAAISGDYDTNFTNPACQGGAFVAGGASVAERDLNEWRNQLACYLPRGDGEVDFDGDVAVITVRWDELRDGVVANLRTFTFQARLQ